MVAILLYAKFTKKQVNLLQDCDEKNFALNNLKFANLVAILSGIAVVITFIIDMIVSIFSILSVLSIILTVFFFGLLIF